MCADLRMCKSLAVAVAFVFVAVVAQDYYYDSEICINVHPGLWVSITHVGFFLFFFLAIVKTFFSHGEVLQTKKLRAHLLKTHSSQGLSVSRLK